MGFAPLPGEGRSTWNEKEAQEAFRVIARLIVPGNPGAEPVPAEAAASGRRRILRPQRSPTLAEPRRPGMADAGRVGSRRAQRHELLVRIRIRQPWGQGAAVSAESKPVGRRSDL